jgi:hypothetical protein
MGWTWSGRGSMLQLYPGLANSAVLINRWPGFQAAVDDLRTRGMLPAQPMSSTQAVAENPEGPKPEEGENKG